MEEEARKSCLKLKNNTWFVNYLTVRKDIQGMGIGTSLIQEGIIPYVIKRMVLMNLIIKNFYIIIKLKH